MSRWTPCKRRDFIRRRRALGFDGPLAGTRHSFMIYHSHRLAIDYAGGTGEPSSLDGFHSKSTLMSVPRV